MELCSGQTIFFLGLLLRSLSTQLFFVVVLLCLVLSMTAFCYEHFFLGTLLRSSLSRLSVLSDCVFVLFLMCVFFTTFIGLLRVRVFLFFPLAIFTQFFYSFVCSV